MSLAAFDAELRAGSPRRLRVARRHGAPGAAASPADRGRDSSAGRATPLAGARRGAAPAPDKVRVFLLEDHLVVREGVRALLREHDDLEVVGEAATLREALESAGDSDVILADLRLGDGRGSQVVAALHERFPFAQILVLTFVDDLIEVQLAFSAGARGYLLKEVGAEELADAVRRVARGEEYVYPRLGAAMARWGQSQGQRVTHGGLSPREREVLVLIARGHTNAEIAAILTVSLRTVEAHRSHIMQKLGASSRAELVRHAADMGLLAGG